LLCFYHGSSPSVKSVRVDLHTPHPALSLTRREGIIINPVWIPAFAGMTKRMYKNKKGTPSD
jgi:hypothetical protein